VDWSFRRSWRRYFSLRGHDFGGEIEVYCTLVLIQHAVSYGAWDFDMFNRKVIDVTLCNTLSWSCSSLYRGSVGGCNPCSAGAWCGKGSGIDKSRAWYRESLTSRYTGQRRTTYPTVLNLSTATVHSSMIPRPNSVCMWLCNNRISEYREFGSQCGFLGHPVGMHCHSPGEQDMYHSRGPTDSGHSILE